MVLGNISMRNKFSFSLLMLLISCSNSNASIVLDENTCEVSMNNQIEKLQLSPPCSFVSAGNGNKSFFQFNESKVFIIAGAPARLSKLTRWSVKESDKCSLEYQGVIVLKNEFSLSEVKGKGLVCPKIGLDEKFYQQFVKN